MKKKIPQLQDMRGIAIIMVVLFHSGNHFLEIVRNGNTGVLLFFMISGFIMSSARQGGTGLTDFFEFMRRRVVRIFPVYIPVLLVFVALFAITGRGSDYHHEPLSIMRNIFLMQDPDKSIHPYAWTLVFEMFYYLTFAVIFILLRANILIYALCMSLPPLAALAFGISDSKNLIFSDYNLYFVTGVILAGCYPHISERSNMWLAMGSFMAFVVTPFVTESNLALLFTTTVFFTTYLCQPISGRLLFAIGNASYSIYLSHALIVVIGTSMISGWPALLLLVPLSLSLGYLYYLKVEIPLTQAARNTFSKHLAATQVDPSGAGSKSGL